MPSLFFAVMLLIGIFAPAAAADFRWAAASGIISLDPETLDETQQLSILSNVYEPLVRRSRDFKPEPALATQWEQTEPSTWRFHLRRGVPWQDQSLFTSVDVAFSWRRIRTSALRAEVTVISDVVLVDPYTVDIKTATPNAQLPEHLFNFLIMSQRWCTQNRAAAAAQLSNRQQNYAIDHAMGTGPFEVVQFLPGGPLFLRRNELWWDKPPAVERAELRPIANPVARVNALLSGDVDMITDVPLDRINDLSQSPSFMVKKTPDLRTIFLGMDQVRQELAFSDVKGNNPFRYRLVREAIALAIDENFIVKQDLQGAAHPTWLLWGPGTAGYRNDLDQRPDPDSDAARRDLAQAGFANGFRVSMDCPDGHYTADAAICRDIVTMLGRIGVEVDLHLEDLKTWTSMIRKPDFRSSLFLFGWTPSSGDAYEVLYTILGTRGERRGEWNVAGYSNSALDELVDRIAREPDAALREQEIIEAARMAQQDIAYVPLHQQVIVYAVRTGLDVLQQPDNHLQLRFVQTTTIGSARP